MPDRPKVAGPPRVWRTAVRTAAFAWVEFIARRAFAVLGDRTGVSSDDVATAMMGYWSAHESIMTDADARSATYFTIDDAEPDGWTIRQRFHDPEGDADWGFTATVDIVEAFEHGAPTLRLASIGAFGEEVSLSQHGEQRVRG